MNIYKEEEQRTREQIATEQRENQEALKNHHALIGMTAAQVRQAWGEPKRVIRTMDERHTYEEWIYGRNGSASLHFVDGVLKSGTNLAACGTVNQTQSRTQLTTQSSTAVHMIL
jgi:hypothetical protein